MNGKLDLVALVPGADEKASIQRLLAHRTESLGIRLLQFQVLKHPRRDPGCFHEGPDVPRRLSSRAARALVLLYREGSSQEHRSRLDIAADHHGRLAAAGWGDRAAVILIDPELEAWLWAESPHVDAVLELRAVLRGWFAH